MSKPTFVVWLEGGVVQGVTGTGEADVIVVDRDVSEADATAVIDGDPVWAYALGVDGTMHPERVRLVRQAAGEEE